MELGVIESARIGRLSSASALKTRPVSGLRSCKAIQKRDSSFCIRCSAVSTIAMDWKPALDEVVLMSSILLAYVAGIVNKPMNPFYTLKRPIVADDSVAEKKGREKNSTSNVACIWDGVVEKLADAVSTTGAPSMALDPSPELCLQALDYGPRTRLLLAASRLLRHESARRMSLAQLCSMAGKVCRCWVSEESARAVNLPAGFMTSSVMNVEVESLTDVLENEAKDYTRKCLERSGKVELYTDFLYCLTTKATRSEDEAACAELVKNVIEDMVVAVSEGAAAMYLSAVSAMKAGWSPSLHSSISSTRALERFRNKVALQQWIHHNFDSVAAIYEDRVELWVFNGAPAADNSFRELCLSRLNVRLRRSRELRELSGWRSFYSLFLEFYDIVGPLLRSLVAKVGQGLSFLLVCLIGRSFGLIYQGIRQSVKWSSD